MKYTPAIELNDALNSKELKVKHISGENFLKILKLKKQLKNAINELAEGEGSLAQDFDAAQRGNQFIIEDKDKAKEFTKKIKEIRNNFEVEVELNFISESELKEYTKEQDTSVTATIFEYLLK